MMKPKILSFGCSTGEEAYDLACNYFPESSVIGLDVSAEVIKAAKKERSVDDRVLYDVGSPEVLDKYGPYDIIFAMSVLCRWPELADKRDASNLFPFEQFERTV